MSFCGTKINVLTRFGLENTYINAQKRSRTMSEAALLSSNFDLSKFICYTKLVILKVLFFISFLYDIF